MKFGDMLVVGTPPPKLTKALAVIAATLHQTYAVQPWIASPDKSKWSCILSSCTVRDFLLRIGFDECEVRPVLTAMQAYRGDTVLHSLGIGAPGKPMTAEEKRLSWNGHMVVVVAGYLIDCTLFQAQRPAWKMLPGMLAVPLGARVFHEGFGLGSLAGLEISEGGVDFTIGWFDNPDNKAWRGGPDYRDRFRRRTVADAMVEKFLPWSD